MHSEGQLAGTMLQPLVQYLAHTVWYMILGSYLVYDTVVVNDQNHQKDAQMDAEE